MASGSSVPQAGSTNYFTDSGSAAETQITTSGGLGEAETGGPVLNVIPKTGGNTYAGTFFAGGANSAMQGDNITQELKDAGLTAPGDFIKTWDVSGNVGGPIKRDRLWYFFTGRDAGTTSYNVEPVSQQEPGKPERLDLRARPGPSGEFRSHVGESDDAADGANQPAQQDQSVLGRTMAGANQPGRSRQQFDDLARSPRPRRILPGRVPSR